LKAYILDKPGAPETLRLADVALPVPAAGEVRVKVEAVALNPVDYKIASKGHPMWRYPFIPGLDVAGVIDAVGTHVDGWKTGDRVYYHGDLRKPGGYAEFAVTDARVLASIPDSVKAFQAAALPTAGFTAYQALHRKVQMEKGGTVLIHGGSGGVGGFAIQLAKKAGMIVLTTASAKNEEKTRALGADFFIDYNGDVAAAVRKITKERGVDIIVETVGSQSATDSWPLLAFGGHMICIVGLPDFSVWKQFEKAASVHEIALGGAHASGDDAAIRDLGKIGAEMMSLVAKGAVDPLVGEVVPFSDLPEALGRLQRREVPSGKIVVSVSGMMTGAK